MSKVSFVRKQELGDSNNPFASVGNLYSAFGLNQSPNFNKTVPGAEYQQQNDYNSPQYQPPYSPPYQDVTTGLHSWNWGEDTHQAIQENSTPNIEDQFENKFTFVDLSLPFEVQKDNDKPANQEYNQFADQGVNPSTASGQPPMDQDQATSNNPESQTGQNLTSNQYPKAEEQIEMRHASFDSKSRVDNETVVANLQKQIDQNKSKSLKAVLYLIEITKVGINQQRETDKEADISQNAQQLFNRTEELFYYYSTAAELEQNAAKKTECKQKAAEQLKEIQSHPLYSKEINNEQERRDACERAGRFIGETTSRIIGLGFGFGAAVAVASFMIPPVMVLYGPMIVAGPLIAVGAGSAAAFMANKLGYKIADITLSNTTALAGRLLDWSKNGLRDWWNKDKEQVKALTTKIVY